MTENIYTETSSKHLMTFKIFLSTGRYDTNKLKFMPCLPLLVSTSRTYTFFFL